MYTIRRQRKGPPSGSNTRRAKQREGVAVMQTIVPATTGSVPYLSTAVAILTAAHPGAACRIERGARLVTAGAVTPIYSIGYFVASESEPGRDYWVQRVNDVLTCDCEDCRQRGAPCKHGWATVLFTACERLDAEQADPIPYALTPRGLVASTHPLTECTACDHDAVHHDGAAGACTRQSVDSEGLYWCDCAAFTLGDDAA